MFKKIRVVLLLLLLFGALSQMWRECQALKWRRSLVVALYPINVDHTSMVENYIHLLNQQDFIALEQFFTQEAVRLKAPLRHPIEIRLGPSVTDVPPLPPELNASYWDMISWSLLFRLFSISHHPDVGVPVDIKLYLLYYDAERYPILKHSTALNKGLIGRVNLFAAEEQHQENMVVIAHELLHTLNATDKYVLQTSQPAFPHGYAAPYEVPLYPQEKAEIMAGRIALTASTSKMAPSLKSVLLGMQTAREIGWLQ